MGAIHVHEFMSLDGVIDEPTWTFDYGFLPRWKTPSARSRNALIRSVDKLHLFVYPLTRGSGPRLFPEESAPGDLSLAACKSYENGVVYLAYRPRA